MAIFACGVALHEAVKACHQLEQEGVSVAVIDMHTIKPLDTNLLDDIRAECDGIVTAEDHSIIGGLGSAVAEYLSTTGGYPIQMVGVKDRFGESGESSDLMHHMGLTRNEIAAKARNIVNSV